MGLVEIGSSDEEADTDYATVEVADSPYRDPFVVYRYLRYIEKATVLKTTFYRSDLETLLPRRWLNDKVINTYMEMLGCHHRRAYFFSTFIYPDLKARPVQEVAGWFRGLDLEKYTSFVFPVHMSSHWALVIVQNNEFLGFDSLGSMRPDCMVAIRRFMHELFAVQKRRFTPVFARLMASRIPQQTNGDDCGVFCCAYARYYTNADVYNQFGSPDIPLLRARMLHEVLAGKIIYT